MPGPEPEPEELDPLEELLLDAPELLEAELVELPPLLEPDEVLEPF